MSELQRDIYIEKDKGKEREREREREKNENFEKFERPLTKASLCHKLQR